MEGRTEMKLKQRFAELRKVGRAVINPHNKSRERDRSPMRYLAFIALLAVIATAGCSNDVPEEAESVGRSASGDPSDCYTTDADLPQHPRDTNRYVVALTEGDANAGALDEYAHCQHLPAMNPSSADPDCYSKGDDNAWHLRGVNLYALALLKGGASAGALDEYAKCKFMSAVLVGTSALEGE